jgi:hypothetical protein
MFGHKMSLGALLLPMRSPSPNACPENFASILKECKEWCKVGTYSLSNILEAVRSRGTCTGILGRITK